MPWGFSARPSLLRWRARGFRRHERLVPSIIVVVGYLASFGFLALVLKSLPVGIVYAIWAAIGIALVAVLGKIMFGDPVPPIAIAGIVLIRGGVALVSLSGATAH